MYAPKFRSWMTGWERFDERLEARIAEWEESTRAEIAVMVNEAMRSIYPPRPVKAFDYSSEMLQALAQQQHPPYPWLLP